MKITYDPEYDVKKKVLNTSMKCPKFDSKMVETDRASTIIVIAKR